MPPPEIRKALSCPHIEEQLIQNSSEFRDYMQQGKVLSRFNMRRSLELLLQVEDMDTMRQYNDLTQRKAHIRKFNSEYSLKVVLD